MGNIITRVTKNATGMLSWRECLRGIFKRHSPNDLHNCVVLQKHLVAEQLNGLMKNALDKVIKAANCSEKILLGRFHSIF